LATTSESVPQPEHLAASENGPEWLTETEETLQKLLGLPQNWNSYGARTIQPHNVRSAIQLLRQIAGHDTPRPIVIPTVRGGVQLEWHTCGIDLEIRSESQGQFHLYYEDPKEGTDWELDLSASEVGSVAELVPQLSFRQ
jgi:hypothetical protein